MKAKTYFSATFVAMAVIFTVCLITSNLLATKVFAIGKWISLPCAVIIFPISYILGDCLTEVYGYRKSRMVIWLAFAMNFAVVLFGQIAVWLPAAGFWQGGEHFDFVFGMAPRVAAASLLAFLIGSTLNALVLSKMKVASEGRGFGWRAIVSSIAGELSDSLVFMPIAFFWDPIEDSAADDAHPGKLQGAVRDRGTAAHLAGGPHGQGSRRD